MLMPKTSMHKNDLSQSREDQVWNPREIPRVKPVSESHAVYQAADDHLRARIHAPDAGHPLTSLFFGEIIHRIGRS
jgi:hypothetical protein